MGDKMNGDKMNDKCNIFVKVDDGKVDGSCTESYRSVYGSNDEYDSLLKEIAKEEEDLRKLSDEKGSAQMLYPEQTETACNSIQKILKESEESVEIANQMFNFAFQILANGEKAALIAGKCDDSVTVEVEQQWGQLEFRDRSLKKKLEEHMQSYEAIAAELNTMKSPFSQFHHESVLENRIKALVNLIGQREEMMKNDILGKNQEIVLQKNKFDEMVANLKIMADTVKQLEDVLRVTKQKFQMETDSLEEEQRIEMEMQILVDKTNEENNAILEKISEAKHQISILNDDQIIYLNKIKSLESTLNTLNVGDKGGPLECSIAVEDMKMRVAQDAVEFAEEISVISASVEELDNEYCELQLWFNDGGEENTIVKDWDKKNNEINEMILEVERAMDDINLQIDGIQAESNSIERKKLDLEATNKTFVEKYEREKSELEKLIEELREAKNKLRAEIDEYTDVSDDLVNLLDFNGSDDEKQPLAISNLMDDIAVKKKDENLVFSSKPGDANNIPSTLINDCTKRCEKKADETGLMKQIKHFEECPSSKNYGRGLHLEEYLKSDETLVTDTSIVDTANSVCCTNNTASISVETVEKKSFRLLPSKKE